MEKVIYYKAMRRARRARRALNSKSPQGSYRHRIHRLQGHYPLYSWGFRRKARRARRARRRVLISLVFLTFLSTSRRVAHVAQAPPPKKQHPTVPLGHEANQLNARYQMFNIDRSARAAFEGVVLILKRNLMRDRRRTFAFGILNPENAERFLRGVSEAGMRVLGLPLFPNGKSLLVFVSFDKRQANGVLIEGLCDPSPAVREAALAGDDALGHLVRLALPDRQLLTEAAKRLDSGKSGNADAFKRAQEAIEATRRLPQPQPN
jgi:hypothetical protein